MKTNLIMILLMLCLGLSFMPQASAEQLLKNPQFDEVDQNNLPKHWFKAMIPGMTKSLSAGRTIEDGTPLLYMEQSGTQPNLYNNWAQTLDNPPAGQRFLFVAAVRGRSLTRQPKLIVVHFNQPNPSNDTAVIGMDQEMESHPEPGVSDWQMILLAGQFPEGTKQSIARIGIEPGGEGRLEIRFAGLITGDNIEEDMELWAQQAMQSTNLKTGDPAPEQSPVESTGSQPSGLELLVNGDFEAGPASYPPPGWFRAMNPERTEKLYANTSIIDGDPHGNFAMIRQDGVKAPVVNNWAQRIETVPVGARVRLEADVMCHNVEDYKGVVMLQCWDMANNPDGELAAAATTQTTNPIGGTHDWHRVAIELDVPETTDVMIVRCGLMGKGEISFDNVSLKVIRPAQGQEPATGAMQSEAPTVKVLRTSSKPDSISRGGFKVTAESLEQLERVRNLAAQFESQARAELGDGVHVRKEVYARGDGIYEMVISLQFDETAAD